MRFFNIDQHISVIEDLRHVFKALGHEVDDWSISNHTWVFNKKRADIPLLENDGWKKIVQKKLWNEFYRQFSERLRQYDCFIACYSPLFSMLYKKFDKPILVYIPIRYEHPLSFEPSQWKKFNRFLRKGVDSGRLFLAANNLYDKYYAEYFLEREVLHIPSLCDYHGADYAPKRENFLLFGREHPAGISPLASPAKQALPAKYEVREITHFKGIVHLPYQVSVMTLFEQYSMNLPLFFPSHAYLTELFQSGADVLKEISWNLYFGKKSGSFIRGTGRFDPNDYRQISNLAYWLRFADYYDVNWMPHLQYFHSVEHLNSLLETADVQSISEQMRTFNQIRKKNILRLWKKALEFLNKGVQ